MEIGGFRARLRAVAGFAIALILAIVLPGSAVVTAQDVTLRTLPEDVNRAHPLVPALNLAYGSLAAMDQVRDYEAAFTKRERVGRRLVHHVMRMKYREEPASVYLYFERPHTGREVIYVDGRNRGMLLAHETGIKSIAGTVSLLPDGPDAMEENRYPISRAGIRNMLLGVINQWEKEAKYGEIEVEFYPNARLGEYDCSVVQTTHPQQRRQFKFAMTRLFVDKRTKIPVRLEQYGFPATAGGKPRLEEEYTYLNLRTNLGLTDLDFDVRNPDYGF